MDDFLIWLNDELASRSWSYNTLAKRAGLSTSAVHATVTGKNKITWEFCASVSKAFGVPTETVFRKAGLLSPIPNQEKIKDLNDLAKNMSESDLDEVLFYARCRYQRGRNTGG